LQRFRWQTLRRLLRIIVQNQIELVHWNFCPPLTNAYLWALSLLAPRLQHYFTDHNSRDLPITPPRRGWLRAGKRLLLKRYRRVLGVSDFIVRCLQEQHSWPRPECCLHFINTNRFRPDWQARLRLREQSDVRGEFVLLTVAHLIPAKGVAVLLRALAVLPKKIVLWVAGSGPEQERLHAMGHDLGVGDRVRWLGLQAHVEPYMQAADAFVCPSLWAEAAGLVNIEAQACGLPVIASNLGGIPEYVAAERSGLLFRAGDHRQLAACIERLYSNPPLCQDMGGRARAWALERFSTAARMENVIALYRDSAGPA
jgi:glycosyltransferase involved in cell wall biosynthesis